MNIFSIERPNNPLNADLGSGIRKHGFRKWYERELLSGHAHMVLCLLAVIALMASMEAFKGASLADKLLDVAFVLLCAVIGVWSLRRYLYLLMRAEHIANQANCPQCATYGIVDALQTSTDLATRASNELQPVRCKRCQHEWVIALK